MILILNVFLFIFLLRDFISFVLFLSTLAQIAVLLSMTSYRTKWRQKKYMIMTLEISMCFCLIFCIENSWVSCYCFCLSALAHIVVLCPIKQVDLRGRLEITLVEVVETDMSIKEEM